ncbi:hypothetical protein TNCV_4918321 [Trichonephila clavipes]|nr:hypothetical protein TNCV_4918321 [Trichonephila clavipes]
MVVSWHFLSIKCLGDSIFCERGFRNLSLRSPSVPKDRMIDDSRKIDRFPTGASLLQIFRLDSLKRADWKYKRIYNPHRCLRVLVERCRKDSSQEECYGMPQ